MKSALKTINKNVSQKFTVAQGVRWENVLTYCNREHAAMIWKYFGRPDRRLIPQLGKNKNRKVVACTLQQFRKRDRENESGTVEIYDSVLENLNILDVALAVKNYKVADLLFNAGLQPTEDFYHFLLKTPHTKPEYVTRIQFIADRMEPDIDDLKVAVKAENAVFVRILMAEISAINDLGSVVTAAEKIKVDAIKKAAKINRDFIRGTNASNRGRIHLLERELREVENHLKRNPSSSYYRTRKQEIPNEIQRQRQLEQAYEQCFKRPGECTNPDILATPTVQNAQEIYNAVRRR